MPTHTVKQGETLSAIAKLYGVESWREIYSHPTNASFRRMRPNPDLIHPGDQINIPTTNGPWKVPNYLGSLLTGADSNLKLDPAIQQQMKALESMFNSDAIGNRLSLIPNWQMLPNMRPQQSQNTVPRQNEPLVPRGKGPDMPRPAEISDLFKALMGVPAIKGVVESAKDQAKRDWKGLSTGDKSLVISQSVLIGGGTLAGLMANRQSRQKALEFIQDKQIPIPGIDGLSIQVSPVGIEKKFILNFDIAAFMRSMNKK